jgi:hypothetical protein
MLSQMKAKPIYIQTTEKQRWLTRKELVGHGTYTSEGFGAQLENQRHSY